ncbi:MAG: hypothetical protein OJF49_000589 [Ktedonobacterales bacterium]|nr:MAG: hypothetical protein OJF49_000589 [Ktedonobacterales bacterium]
MESDARGWFEREGLLRYSAFGDGTNDVVEDERMPLTALGPHDDDFVLAPNPDHTDYPGKPMREMSMEEYNTFMYRWFEAAVHAGDIRCVNCGKLIRDDDDLPDADTWDAIFIEKELVAWMVVHFDCKKQLPKKLKGMHPFELNPRDPPVYDLSRADVPIESD